MRHQLLCLAAVLMIGLMLAGCDAEPEVLPTLIPTSTTAPTEEPTSTPPPSPTPPPPVIIPRTEAFDPADQAYFRVVHAAPDTQTLDVYIEALAVATGLDFTRYTDQSGLTAGDYQVTVMPSGVRRDTAEPLLSSALSIRGGQSLILAITGTPDALALVTYEEAAGPLNRGQSRLRVIHAVPRGPDFTLRRDGSDITPVMSFGQASEAFTFDSGRTELAFQSGLNTLLSYPANLAERYSYTLMLVGRADDLATLTPILFDLRAPGLTEMRFANAAASIGMVDVYVGTSMIGGPLAFGDMTTHNTFVSDFYTVAVYTAGVMRDAVEPLVTTQVLANPDDSLTLLLMGEPNSLRIVTVQEDITPTTPGMARVTFINTLENVPRVRLQTEGEDYIDLSYALPALPQEYPAREARFYWYRLEGGQPTDQLEELGGDYTLLAGFSYIYLFTGQSFAYIYPREVGVVGGPEVAAMGSAELIATSPPPARVRGISATPTNPFTALYVDAVPISETLTYGLSTPLVVIQPGERVITLRDTSEDRLLARLNYNIEPGVSYTVLSHGSLTAGYDLFIIPDFELILDSTENTHIRLINLSPSGGTQFGLGYSAPEQNVLQPAEETGYRQSLTLGITTPIRDVEDLSFSRPLRFPPGTHNLQVIDTGRTSVALILPVVTLEAGRHYDMVVFQDAGGLRVTGFLVPYPTP